MKIVTWNCNGAFRKKYHLLDKFEWDLLIIQECENPEESAPAYRDWAKCYLWKGENKHKGLGVFAKAGISLEPLEWDDGGFQSFLPCHVAGSFDLMAVWTKQANSPNFGYIGQLWRYLGLHKDKMAGRKILLAGDLNSNTRWDEWDRWWNHSDVVKILKDLDIYSIYHEYHGEEQGKESCPTLYHRRNSEKPYHVDYVFASSQLIDPKVSNIKIGEKDDWLAHSDHMPIIFQI